MDVYELQISYRNVSQCATLIIVFLYFVSNFAHVDFVLRKCKAVQWHFHEFIEITFYRQKKILKSRQFFFCSRMIQVLDIFRS